MQVLITGDGALSLIANDRGIPCRHLGVSAAQGLDELPRDRKTLLQQFFLDDLSMSKQV